MYYWNELDSHCQLFYLAFYMTVANSLHMDYIHLDYCSWFYIHVFTPFSDELYGLTIKLNWTKQQLRV